MENQKYNVESFNLDHTKVTAPYVRQAAKKTGTKVDIVSKYDIRFCQPNEEFMPKLWCCLVTQLCLTLFATPMDWNPPGSSVHVISQARILK